MWIKSLKTLRMPENTLEELKKSSKRLKDDIQNEARGLFHLKSRRETISITKKINIDPFSFLIGGIGVMAVGLVTDETNIYDEDNHSRQEGIISSAVRVFAFPIRAAVRFFAGGCIYTILDACVLNIMGHRAPYISGGLTATLFAVGTRPSVFLGSILGMAAFAEVADMIVDMYLNDR